ncbi:MAG: hypothetical protein ACYDBS_01975 [Acidimicrobiales bacterium]
MDTSSLQHVGRYSGLTPGGVVDAFALAILGSYLDKCLFKSRQVVLEFIAPVAKALLEIAPLLDQVHSLQGISICNSSLDFFKALLQRLSAYLTTTTGLVLFEGYEVTAYGMALTTASSERVLVLARQGRLGCPFTGGHRDIVFFSDRKSKSGSSMRVLSLNKKTIFPCMMNVLQAAPIQFEDRY